MATLTGYKNVRESGDAVTGHSNPVFVFDEATSPVVDNSQLHSINDEFVDASSSVATIMDDANEQPAQVVVVGGALNEKTEKGEDPLQQQRRRSSSPTSSTSAGSDATQKINDSQDQSIKVQSKPDTQASQDKLQQPMVTIELTQPSAPGTPTTEAKNDATKKPRSYLTTTGGGTDGNGDEQDDLSFLAGCGKSPRTPRRSPLMALFRGQKERASVRKTYTDEDAFEIEWSRLHLAINEKWWVKAMNAIHQAPSMLGMGTTNERASAISADDKAEMGMAQMQNGLPLAAATGGCIDQRPMIERAVDARGRKLILNNVSGRVRSGEITAIMGPSGAGKTSLLHSLFGKHRSNVEGSIRVTGAPDKKHLTVCTIPQSESLIGHLTTHESLWFASRLKNTDKQFDHERNIRRVVELLDLSSCQHTRINKCSGGQQKRVSIAQEMLSNPDILVLDEPTSGLDSLTCYRTVKVLRDLVEASKAHNMVNPMAIVLTIHQPHVEVLELFHSVIIMAVGGACMYQGPPGDMEPTIKAHAGPECQILPGYNAASYMVEIASGEYGHQPIKALVAHQEEKFEHEQQQLSAARQLELNSIAAADNADKSSSAGNKHNKRSNQELYGKPSDHKLQAANNNNNYSHNSHDIDSRIMTPDSSKNSDGVFWYHVKLMTKRAFLANGRDPLLFTIRIGAHIFIPLVVAFIYGNTMGVPNACPTYSPEVDLSPLFNGEDEAFERMEMVQILVRKQFQNIGLHFMVYYAFGLCMLAFTAISFPLIMHVLVKEVRNGWYSLSTFILGKMFAEIPMALILPPISVGIIYMMTGQPSSYLQWRFFVQSIILILIIMIAEAQGLIFGAVFMNSMQTAVFSASVSTVPFILLSGFLVRIDEVPKFLQYLSVFSYFRHSVEALIITRYGFGMCPCDPAVIACGSPIAVGIHPQLLSTIDYYMENYGKTPDAGLFDSGDSEETNVVGNNRTVARIVEATTELPPEILVAKEALESSRVIAAALDAEDMTAIGPQFSSEAYRRAYEEEQQRVCRERLYGGAEPPKHAKFFDKMAQMITKAAAFGKSIKSCEDIKPYTMRDMNLKDSQLAWRILYLFANIVVLKLISYFVVNFCIKLKL
ncbi:ATP-binding cassette sub-family G member 1 [Fragariocoptes setiger]|uniref:ATP-binding cassette sub-family G member 1 n=1 Tax=Fragariocoptes setiger TaxID=1670756 RepID=A0ABQ7S715_9ACAR|nr:ATP-binding cassette sub-family G member 1 [Fragariocoptes setiger]